ncbi:MAG: hypothetical protein KDC39_14930, partial [Actinobacteria bacterium]|nr:hypothetical protein [Actinomycetota bacterium]
FMRSMANIATNAYGYTYLTQSQPGDLLASANPSFGNYAGILSFDKIFDPYVLPPIFFSLSSNPLLGPGSSITIDDGYSGLADNMQSAYTLIADNPYGFAWSCLQLGCTPGAYPYSIGVPYDDSYVPPDSPSPSS